MIMGLVAALVLIGLGFVLTGGNGRHQISDSPEALELCEEGTRDLNAFRWQSAVEKLGQSLELDPTLAEASIARAFAYYRLGRTEEFESEVARADSLTAVIEDDHRRMVAQLRIGGVPFSKFYDMKDSLLTRLQVEDPDNIYVLETLAMKAGMANNVEEVEKIWLRLLEVDPNYANSYNNLGYMELHRGNYDQAMEYMQKYAFLAPDMANPHDSLGEVLMTLGRYEEAEAEFRLAIKMQPDFYHSLINLGKIYVARGQLDMGLDILKKVHAQVESSKIQREVDNDILITYLVSGLDEELSRMIDIFAGRYPDHHDTPIFRGIKLAYQGQVEEGRAIMDSTLAVWKSGEDYQKYTKVKTQIDSATYQFAALLADVVEDYQTSAANWEKGVETMKDTAPYHEQWYARYRWASALHKDNRSAEALEIIDPMLQVNPRLINVLVLKVECHLALRQGAQARKALEQLQWSLRQSDDDFPARAKAEELALQVSALAVGN
jgi:tetratricopeptide (TPR) repeat protein